jgi:hypothetical protein
MDDESNAEIKLFTRKKRALDKKLWQGMLPAAGF